FGMEGEQDAAREPVISVERPDQEAVADVRLDAPPPADFDPFAPSPETPAGEAFAAGWVEQEAAPPAPTAPQPPAEEGGWSGITRPSKRGSSARFLTDVIVELGLASQRQVEDAVETSRNSGTAPERILIDQGALTNDGLARALAERYGLDHLDLGVFQVDMAAANLISTTVAKRYQAVPVAFADKRTLLVAMADPSNVLAVDDIAIMTGHEVRVAVAPPDDIVGL